MSKASYWQRGETIDYINRGTMTIEANEVVALVNRLGVAGTNIAPGEKGSLHVTGVFGMPKGSEEIAAGTDVYYSEADGLITTAEGTTAVGEDEGAQTAAVHNVKAGFAVETAASGDAAVLVKINA